jgi:hypothetical protein
MQLFARGSKLEAGLRFYRRRPIPRNAWNSFISVGRNLVYKMMLNA